MRPAYATCHVHVFMISFMLPTVFLLAHSGTNEFPTGLLIVLAFLPPPVDLVHIWLSQLEQKSDDHAYTCKHTTTIANLAIIPVG